MREPDRLHAPLRGIAERMTAARAHDDAPGHLARDTRFHAAFFDHSGNRFLFEACGATALKTTAPRHRLGVHPDHMAKSFREHGEIAEAVGRADLSAALDILRRHIDRKEGAYRVLAAGEGAG